MQAHDFITASYWRGNLDMMRTLLPEAQLLVYEEAGEILGFVGLQDDYLAGIFVDSKAQSRGIGRALLAACKAERTALHLCVYQKNPRAQAFYIREGFQIEREAVEELTGERELCLRWECSSKQEKTPQ